MDKKTALVLGAGGFIGSHMVKRLRSEGYWVRGVDLKYPDFTMSAADEFIQGDLREVGLVARALDVEGDSFDEIYQFAADMGGAGYIFTDEHSADIMHNSASINLNVLNEQVTLNRLLGVNKTKIFYSSSACMYPEHNQLDPENPDCRESSAYPPTQTQSMDGRNYFPNVSTWHIIVTMIFLSVLPVITIYLKPRRNMGWRKRKGPSVAICRKVALLPEVGGTIEVWGDDSRQDPSSSSTNVLKQPID